MSNALNEKLRILQIQYLEKLAEWRDHLQAFHQKENWDQKDLERLIYLSHKLSGSGGMYGYNEISSAGQALESHLLSSSHDRETASALLQSLLSACEDALGS